MVYVDKLLKMNSKWLRGDLLERQLKDYFANTKNLMLQRQSIFFAATTLTAFYFDPVISFMCYGLVLLTEAIDLFLTRRVDKWKDGDPAKARMFLLWAVVNTVFSAVAISLFVILIAVQEGDDGHFTPCSFSLPRRCSRPCTTISSCRRLFCGCPSMPVPFCSSRFSISGATARRSIPNPGCGSSRSSS
ncbi:hypothetical protein ACFOHS_04015 [Jhaorihella thermophila]